MKSKFVTALLAAILLSSAAHAQTPTSLGDPGGLYATRAQLEQLLREYERAVNAEGYSDALREVADDEAELIRSRLRDGDFQVGDQIVLSVPGQTALTATFTVGTGRVLSLPELGDVPLAGILRSELKQALTDHISKYIRNAQVHVQSNVRLAFFGEVGNPGYYVVPAEGVLTDVLMLAGGPTKDAKQKEIKIKRGEETIWEGEALQLAIVEGRTLDQLSLRAGDEIQVPGSGGSLRETIMFIRWIPFTIVGFLGLKRFF